MLAAVSSCTATCCTICACETCKCISSSISRKAAKFVYCILFLLSLIIAWVLRDYGRHFISEIPWIKYSYITGVDVDDKWYGMQAVSRISFGCFIYFGTLGILTIGIKNQNDPRDNIQNKFWIPKILLWIVFNALPFLFSNDVISTYMIFSQFGSVIFLLIQAIIFIDFLYLLNGRLIEMEDKGEIILISTTIISYISAIIFNCFLYSWFGSHDCDLNIFFITSNILLSVTFSLVSVLPQIEHGSLLPSSLLTLYNAYLCYSSLSSEPSDYICNTYIEQESTDFSYVGVFMTMVSLIYSAFRAGSENLSFEQIISYDEIVLEDEKEIKYNYSFFHFIFSLAGMYMAMLYTNWGDDVIENINIGWTNVWVKISTSWVISLLYLWTLIAPIVIPQREFLNY